MDGTHKALRLFFWFAFGAFLLASIPHVAYFFRAYEPVDAGLDWWYWGVSVFIAMSIDITIFLLSMTVASLQRRGKSKVLIFSVWVFIIGLAGLSWYMNDRYALHFINSSMISANAVTVPFTGVKIDDINPLIASCFQILAIAYTWISDKIAADENPKTAEQLKDEADELEKAAVQRKRIAAIQRANGVGNLTGLVDAGAAVLGHLKGKGKQDTTAFPDILAEPTEEQKDTDKVAAVVPGGGDQEEVPIDDQGEQTGDELARDMQALLPRYPGLDRWLSSGQRSASDVEIVEVTGHTLKMVDERIKDRTFIRTRRPGTYRLDTVVGWLKIAPLPKSYRSAASASEAVPASSSNGHSTVNLDQLVTTLRGE